MEVCTNAFLLFDLLLLSMRIKHEKSALNVAIPLQGPVCPQKIHLSWLQLSASALPPLFRPPGQTLHHSLVHHPCRRISALTGPSGPHSILFVLHTGNHTLAHVMVIKRSSAQHRSYSSIRLWKNLIDSVWLMLTPVH